MIRFPKHHIASSVINRLLNVADELEADAIATGSLVRPSAPAINTDVGAQSLDLDAALATPTPATPPIEAAPDPGGTVTGRPLLDTLVDPKQ